MPKAALHTLGCKVNQYETQRMAEALRAGGFDVVEFADEADVYVINSCTVTQTADSKSRQAARAAARRRPGAFVVLTGCYAETAAEQARRVEGVSLVLGNREKSAVVEHIWRSLPCVEAGAPPGEDLASSRAGRSRALLKVQDGCDQFCSYCAVPLARPDMWSRPADDVLQEATRLAADGFREIVLTGIRLGRYEYRGIDLAGLLSLLADVPGVERIRLSSLEYTDAPPALLDILASERKLCRHLHLPLQSGDDGVLERMSRPYAAAKFEQFVESARSLVADIAITTDMMVGFPGETDREFNETYRFAERMEFARTHIFRYSPRPGTAASRLKDDVPACEKKRRSELLAELAALHSDEFARRFIGKTMTVLVEGKGAKLCSGLTDNYIRVSFVDRSAPTGDLVRVRIGEVSNGRALGVVTV